MASDVNTIRYGWCICHQCRAVRRPKNMPPSKSNPSMPGLLCKRCQRKIDHPPKPKPKPKPPARIKVGRYRLECEPVGMCPQNTIPMMCRAVKERKCRSTIMQKNSLLWAVFTGHGEERHYLGAGNTKEEAIAAARKGMWYIKLPERSGDESGNEPEFLIYFPASSGEPAPTGLPKEFMEKLARTLMPFEERKKYWAPLPPYVIPPSSSDPSKPRTRFEHDEMGYVELYVHDKCVGIGETWRGAVKDAIEQRLPEGKQVSLIPELFGT